MKINKWFTQKTTWAALAGICTGVGLIVQGDTSNGIMTVISSIQVLFVRQAINKI